MDYIQAKEYIHSLLKFGSNPGLERIRALTELMGNPQDGLKYIHVAGTNGKGSVCTMLSNIFRKAGYRTGLFMSPYVIDFCERIQVDNVPVDGAELGKLVEKIKPLCEQCAENGLQPTEFEVITALAFRYFRDKNCDIVILETGLGGLYDSTNIIKNPLVSVITQISIDHTSVLGNTTAEIAVQKCGIIKPDGITVTIPTQDEAALTVIMSHAAQKRNRLIMPGANSAEILKMDAGGTTFTYGDLTVELPLLGRHQVANAVTAIEAARAAASVSSLKISDGDIISGIKSSSIPARVQLVSSDPPVLVDGAHNENGAQALEEALKHYFKNKKLTAVVGILRDKKYNEMLRHTGYLFERMLTVTPDNPRALTASELAQAASKVCGNVSAAGSVREALKLAVSGCGDDSAVIVYGSLYLAGEVLKLLGEKGDIHAI